MVCLIKGMENKRLNKEFNLLEENYDIEKKGMLWQLALLGPDDSPYFGGTFLIEISIPEKYPFEPPKIRFETKIYHPNINHKGEICLEILSDGWKPSNTVLDAMKEISSLLSNPKVDDPMAPEVANVFLKNRDLFNKNARDWVLLYAM